MKLETLPSTTDYQATYTHKTTDIIIMPSKGNVWSLYQSTWLPPECLDTVPFADPQPIFLQYKPW